MVTQFVLCQGWNKRLGKKQLLLIWCHNVPFSINCITFPMLNEWVDQMPKIVLQDVKSSLIILRHLNKQYQAVTSHVLASPQPFSSFIWRPIPKITKIFNVGMLVTVHFLPDEFQNIYTQAREYFHYLIHGTFTAYGYHLGDISITISCFAPSNAYGHTVM